MKPILMKVCVGLLVMFMAGCSKSYQQPGGDGSYRNKHLQFQLYSDADFSNVHDSIFFRISVTNNHGTTFFDSALKPMQISEIPLLAQKISVSKDFAALNLPWQAGFYYTIKNVGNSWHIDSVGVDPDTNIISFNFR